MGYIQKKAVQDEKWAEKNRPYRPMKMKVKMKGAVEAAQADLAEMIAALRNEDEPR